MLSIKKDKPSCKRDEQFDPPLKIRNIVIKNPCELRSLVKLGPGIPPKYEFPPWRISLSEDVGIKKFGTVEKVNKLLNYSMKIQGATVKGKRLMRVDTMALFGLLRSYIRSVLDSGDRTPDMVQGVMKVPPNGSNIHGIKSIWLDFGKGPASCIPIEVHFDDDNRKCDQVFKKTNRSVFLKQNYSKLNIFGKDQGPIVDYYATSERIEKYCLFSVVLDSVLVYMALMDDFMRNELGVEPEDLTKKWLEMCWNCGKKEANTLKTCKDCGIAKYCGVKCQKAEWKIHKILHDVAVMKIAQNSVDY